MDTDLTKIYLHRHLGRKGNKEYRSYSLAILYLANGKNCKEIMGQLGTLSAEEGDKRRSLLYKHSYLDFSAFLALWNFWELGSAFDSQDSACIDSYKDKLIEHLCKFYGFSSTNLAVTENSYDSLFVDRGPAGGNMTTDALFLVVKKEQTYKISGRGLEMSASHLDAIDLENQAAHPEKMRKPPFVEVSATWDKTHLESGLGNNILGDNGLLILPSEIIHVPCIEASKETLAYYGALLLKEGDLVRFPDSEYPIFKMTVGPRYVEDFLMTEKGGGFYLEYHHDKPHFHMPMQGGGYYLLARWNDKKKKLRITGFKIQDGQAVYTKKGAIHCDAALNGSLLVGYDKAENSSTVLLRTADQKKTKLEFNEVRLDV